MNVHNQGSIEETLRKYPLNPADELGGMGLYSNASDFAKLVSEILTILRKEQDATSSKLRLSSTLLSEYLPLNLPTSLRLKLSIQL
jgi:hypothetical protein